MMDEDEKGGDVRAWMLISYWIQTRYINQYDMVVHTSSLVPSLTPNLALDVF